VRYRTAAVLSVALIVAMFGLPDLLWAVFLPALRQGLPNPVPDYEKILLNFALYCDMWRFLVVPPAVSVFFAIASFTRPSRPRQVKTHPSPII
jgi:hypothetical protein